jgi:hypothetical protein
MESRFDPDDDRVFAAPQGLCAEPATAESARHAGVASSSRTLDGTRGGGPMLDDLVAGLWEGLAAHRVVQCLVCAAEMGPEYGAHALPIGGRCDSCGSTLR